MTKNVRNGRSRDSMLVKAAKAAIDRVHDLVEAVQVRPQPALVPVRATARRQRR